MIDNKNKDPLHGITLEMILTHLVENYGWEGMAAKIRINCFAKDPSIKSSLVFLRRTPWARKKVEELYLGTEGDRDLGVQPIARIMAASGLAAHDLVAGSTEQVTHKMVARAMKGRRLTANAKGKVLRALNAAAGKNYKLTDLFNY